VSDVLRSEGQRLLRELGVTGTEIASTIGASKPTVSAWMTGRKTPTADYKRALAKAYRIPVQSWSARPGVQEKPRAEAAPAPATSRASRVTILDALIAQVEQARAQADLAPAELVKLASTQSRLIEQREELDRPDAGAALEQALRSEAFQRIRKAVVDALAPHPEAAKAVVAALRALGEEA
jgi:transcriptional regulator with XRE-family HTH domain